MDGSFQTTCHGLASAQQFLGFHPQTVNFEVIISSYTARIDYCSRHSDLCVAIMLPCLGKERGSNSDLVWQVNRGHLWTSKAQAWNVDESRVVLNDQISFLLRTAEWSYSQYSFIHDRELEVTLFHIILAICAWSGFPFLLILFQLCTTLFIQSKCSISMPLRFCFLPSRAISSVSTKAM